MNDEKKKARQNAVPFTNCDEPVATLSFRLSGCPRRVPRRQEFLSVRCFEYGCAAGFSLGWPICFDFLFLLPRKIGLRELKINDTGFWMLLGAPFVSRENMETMASHESSAFKLKSSSRNQSAKEKKARTLCPSPFFRRFIKYWCDAIWYAEFLRVAEASPP